MPNCQTELLNYGSVLLKNPELKEFEFDTLLENYLGFLKNDHQSLSLNSAYTKDHFDKEGNLTSKGQELVNSSLDSLSLEAQHRKGKFLVRIYSQDLPLVDEEGNPTLVALAAQAWGEEVPKTREEAEALVVKGNELISLEENLDLDQSQEQEVESDREELNLLSASIHLLSEGLLRIPLAKRGTFKHPQYGQVEFTDRDFEDVISNFESNVLGFEPYATYGHLIDPSMSVDAELKKGKPKKIEVEEDVLYVLTEPTPDTLELAKNGEYEYCSGEFIRNYVDKVTGENKGTVLMRYALTNSPFIPFADKKIEVIEALSHHAADSDSCIQNSIKSVIKLSSYSENSELIDSDSTQLNMQEDIAKETLETPEVESTEPTPIETPEVPVVHQEEKPAVTESPAVETPAAQYDLNKIVDQVFAQAKIAYEAQIKSLQEQSNQVISTLKDEISGLNQKLNAQEATVQTFSNSMFESNKKARYAALANQGMPPVFIQKFSELESALDTGSKVIKLSNTAGEIQEKAIADEIAALVLEALHSEPVQVEQYGQSVSVVAANALTADLQKIIDANRQAAQKKTLG